FALAARPVPGNGGAARQDRRRDDSLPSTRSPAERTRGAADEHPRRWADHRADLGAGNRRRTTILVDQESHQLLRAMWRGKEHRQHGAANAAVQTAQQASANHTDRSGQDGATLQPDVVAALRSGKAAWKLQPRNAHGGAKVGGVSGSRRPRPDAFSGGGPR